MVLIPDFLIWLIEQTDTWWITQWTENKKTMWTIRHKINSCLICETVLEEKLDSFVTWKPFCDIVRQVANKRNIVDHSAFVSLTILREIYMREKGENSIC